MRYYTLVFCVYLFVFNCSGNENKIGLSIQSDLDYRVPFSSDILSFEKAFGSEESGTSNEFLLASPVVPRVDSRNFVLVADENCIKVFDSDGKEKGIIGQRGQGPGDFRETPVISISPTNYLTAITGTGKNSFFSIYSPDYSFIKMERFRVDDKILKCLKEHGITSINFYYIQYIYSLNENEIIFKLKIQSEKEHYDMIVYRNGTDTNPLICVKNPDYIFVKKGLSASGTIFGTTNFVLLPERKILFINTAEDIHNEKGSFYTIHIISIDTGIDNKIMRKYTPVPFPEKERIIEYYKNYYRSDSRYNEAKPLIKRKVELFTERVYIPSVMLTTIDNNYVFIYFRSSFAYTYGFKQEKDCIVDILNTEDNTFINTINLPEYFATIRNGRIYDIDSDKNGFSEIRRYRLDPSIYKK